jgi:two-component system cell cycle response regulator
MATGVTATTALVAVGAAAALLAVALALVLARSYRRARDDGRRLDGIVRQLEEARDEARRNRLLADLDGLTGLHNRRYFHELLAREVARAQRYGRELALVVFDLDDFKSINDGLGHLAGDAVLAETAERARGVLRSADIACRVGGDEFAVLLPEASGREAELLYRRLQRAVSSRPVAEAGDVSVSAGIAELQADDEPNTFFERADQALYRAKERGKGQVVRAPGRSAPSDATRRPGTASSQ